MQTRAQLLPPLPPTAADDGEHLKTKVKVAQEGGRTADADGCTYGGHMKWRARKGPFIKEVRIVWRGYWPESRHSEEVAWI